MAVVFDACTPEGGRLAGMRFDVYTPDGGTLVGKSEAVAAAVPVAPDRGGLVMVRLGTTCVYMSPDDAIALGELILTAAATADPALALAKAFESEAAPYGMFCMSHDNRSTGTVYCAKFPRHDGPCDYSRVLLR